MGYFLAAIGAEREIIFCTLAFLEIYKSDKAGGNAHGNEYGSPPNNFGCYCRDDFGAAGLCQSTWIWIRRILTLSSQNAFAQLLLPGGFYDNSVSRIALPSRFGGGSSGSILSVVLQSAAFRNSLQKQLNRAAEKGAERAAPLVADAVRNVGIEDAAAIVRGGPQAATAFLRGKMGTALISAMLPGVSDGLRLFDDAVIGKAVQSVSGYNVAGLASDLSPSTHTSA